MRSSKDWSSGSTSTSRSSMRTQTDDDAPSGHRQLKRSSASFPVPRSPASRHHSWLLLSRAGAWRDGFPGDRTMSAISRTSKGDDNSVSFELVEPPGISVLLTVDCLLQASPTATPGKSITGNVIVAHRDVVLLAIASSDGSTSPLDSVVDLFVYQASRDPSPVPPLFLLPSLGGHVIYCDFFTDAMGIMSCTSSDDDEGPSFVVAYLEMSPATKYAHLFRSGTGQWESFKNMHVHGANGADDLFYWMTDAVVTYGRRYMIWVDYYRGIILMDLSSYSNSQSETNLPPPRLQYVPLPVNRVKDPKHIDFGYRGCPKDSRSVCVTRYGIKFVSIDTQHWSNFGLGNHHVRTWSQRFRITTWSLHEHDYTWRRDVTMHEQEFWGTIGTGERFGGFPHVQPRFPVIDLDNPDIVVFRLATPANPAGDYSDCDAAWMIEVDLRKKALLAATAYSKKESDGLSGDAETINSARLSDCDPISSELSRYMEGGQASKKT